VNDLSAALTSRPEGSLLAVRITPKAGRDEVGEVRGGRLLVRVCAAPEDGKANEAVIRLLAKSLGVAPGAIEVHSGSISRDKLLLIRGCTTEQLIAAQL
jgi:uncharacterized protein (TIGR00251 family)